MFDKTIIYASRECDIPMYANGDKLYFHYQATFCDNDLSEVIDDSRKPYPHGYGQAMELILGKQFKLPAWEACLKSMRIGEVSRFILPMREILDFPFVSKQLRDISKRQSTIASGADDHCHSSQHMCAGMACQVGTGYEILDQLIKNPRDLSFTFELLNVIKQNDYEAASWQLDRNQKLDTIPTLRQRGNECFKEGKWDEAKKCYEEALHRLDICLLEEKPGDPEWIELDMKKVAFFLNLSQCYLNLNDPYLAISMCNEVLEREPRNEKAIYRRAKANVEVWELKKAKEDWKLLTEIDPTMNSTVLKELQQIEKLEKEKTITDRSCFKAMLGDKS